MSRLTPIEAAVLPKAPSPVCSVRTEIALQLQTGMRARNGLDREFSSPSDWLVPVGVSFGPLVRSTTAVTRKWIATASVSTFEFANLQSLVGFPVKLIDAKCNELCDLHRAGGPLRTPLVSLLLGDHHSIWFSLSLSFSHPVSLHVSPLCSFLWFSTTTSGRQRTTTQTRTFHKPNSRAG